MVLVGRVISINFPNRRVRVFPETDHPERFLGMRRFALQTTSGEMKELHVERVELLANAVVATLSDRHDTDEIAAAKNARVVVREEDRYPLDEHEHYIDDLIGMQVVDVSGAVLGRLQAVYRTAAHDVYEVIRQDDRELLVPAVKERILAVDVANKVVTVDPEGLLEG
jgi:16S rRNA processing protein RimM